MFLFEKYAPKKTKELLFNNDIIEQLTFMAKHNDIPHVIISGPNGGGKKTIVRFFLEALYDETINTPNKVIYKMGNQSSKKDIEIFQSFYHIIIEPTNTSADKYIIQEIIKKYAKYKTLQFTKASRPFKTILIYNMENLSLTCQSALRRTMEMYAKTCRFIMVCNNLSKIIEPLKSRCRIFCVPIPSENDIAKTLFKIALCENIYTDISAIVKRSHRNIRDAIWILDEKKMECKNILILDELYDKLIDLILGIDKTTDVIKIYNIEIKKYIYDILITNTKGADIIATILEKIIHKSNNDKLNKKIIIYASTAENNMSHGRRDIMHIDYFIIGIIKELLA